MTNDEIDKLSRQEKDVLLERFAEEKTARSKAGELLGPVGVRDLDLYSCDVCGGKAERAREINGMAIYLCEQCDPVDGSAVLTRK